jgi:hypothetical protein
MNASEQIDKYIESLTDWRGTRLASLRKLINENAPELSEDWKWSCPVWTKKSPICAISAFKGHVKINFFQGASLEDPEGIFNSGLDSKQHRSINLGQEDSINEPAIKALIPDSATR